MLTVIVAHAIAAPLAPWVARVLGGRIWPLAAAVPGAVAIWALVRAPDVLAGRVLDAEVAWAPALGLDMAFRVDALSLVVLLIVAGVGAVVLWYCAYTVEDGRGRVAGLLVGFAGAMAGLVTADHLIGLYVFWELTTVFSFLLIGGRGRGAAERAAAARALMITAGGGLAMLLGFVLLGEAAGSYRISAILAEPPAGGSVTAAFVLVLIGVCAKSALFPLHAWLPAAMVAPTPVSAYLHAAAMVKAGVYLVARLSPGFAAEIGWWSPTVTAVGLASLVLGAWRALRETDLKKLLAYGTISELGMLVALFGAGTRTSALAGVAMLVAHALFKAPLFLVVGVIDHQAGTRQIGELSGVGRRLPSVAAVAGLAGASMAGLPPLLGYLGKEAGFEAFHHDPAALAAFAVGSALTVAYTLRLLVGAFGSVPDRPPTPLPPPARGFAVPAAVLAALGLALGVHYPLVAAPAEAYADAYPVAEPYSLALWHGLTPTLTLSVAAVLAGVAGWFALRGGRADRLPRLLDPQAVVGAIAQLLERAARGLTRRVQVGSLPVYLGVLLTTVLAVTGVSVLRLGPSPADLPVATDAAQVPLTVVALAAALAAGRTRSRLGAVLLTGFVGYAVAGVFLVRGGPDLAITQFLVESMTLVVMVLLLRRLPARFEKARRTRPRAVGAALATAVGGLIGLFAFAMGRAADLPPVGAEHLARAEEAGAENAVAAILVDFRALDTLGEIAVVLVAALGAMALVRPPRSGGVTEGAATEGEDAEAAGEHR